MSIIDITGRLEEKKHAEMKTLQAFCNTIHQDINCLIEDGEDPMEVCAALALILRNSMRAARASEELSEEQWESFKEYIRSKTNG